MSEAGFIIKQSSDIGPLLKNGFAPQTWTW